MAKHYGIHPVVILAHIQDTTARANFGRKRDNKWRIAGSIAIIVLSVAAIVAAFAIPPP